MRFRVDKDFFLNLFFFSFLFVSCLQVFDVRFHVCDDCFLKFFGLFPFFFMLVGV